MAVPGKQEEFPRGLEGVIASTTKIGFVDGEKGRLVYRGYDINTLAENSTYEEVSYLLVYGTLPTSKQLSEYKKKLVDSMDVSPEVADLIKRIGGKTHPMSTLRTAVSYMGALDDARSSKPTAADQEVMGINLIAKMPVVVGMINRVYRNNDIVKPDKSLGYAANFLYMSTGKKPDSFETKLMDTALILHADHGMNASTFTAMVVISTLSDMYSAVTAAIGSLKGPLHGEANEHALKMIREVGSPENAEKYIKGMVERKERVPGFGHRVYKVYDPRARILKKFSKEILHRYNNDRLFETAESIEKVMIGIYGERGIFPNVDFYSGSIYASMGFEPAVFTPIFATGRISGWVSRSLEYISDNRLFRPRAKYIGERGPLDYVPIEKR